MPVPYSAALFAVYTEMYWETDVVVLFRFLDGAWGIRDERTERL